MAIYGYARVSTKEQNLDRQIQQLSEYVSDSRNIICDKLSGKSFDRKGYNLLTGTPITAPLLRKGDTLIICCLDRLGRNYGEIKAEWQRLTSELGVNIKVLDMPLLDTTVKDDNLDHKFIADLVLQILSYVAEKERENTLKRIEQGISAMPVDENGKKYSRKTGNPTGRPPIKFPKEWDKFYQKWKAKECTAVYAMQELSLKPTTFYKLVKNYESKE